MKTKSVKELSAHLAPKPLAVRDFWRKWTVCCKLNFAPMSQEVQCIERLKAVIATDPMFVQLDEGLEQLLLNNRGRDDVQLTPKAWLALTWICLDAFVSEHARKHTTEARKKQARVAATAALDKARMLFILSHGQAIEGVSLQDWIEKGPWRANAPLWALLFRHGLHLVHPHSEPLYWALRQRWLEISHTTATLADAIHSMESPPEMAPWCLPRAMTVLSVPNVLRSGRRWALRAQNSMHDTVLACAPSPQWQGVYLFSLWLNRQDAGIASPPEEVALLRACMKPDNLAYWLVLCHDCAHHQGQRRRFLDTFNLQEDTDYVATSNMLIGLQMFAPLAEVELAISAWNRWKDNQKQETVSLPDLA